MKLNLKEKKLIKLFVFGIYRSGTTALARTLAGEKNIAFCSDPIRPFFNWYRTTLEKQLNPNLNLDAGKPLSDYFKSDIRYIKKLLNSKFSETISPSDLIKIRQDVINHSSSFSPKFSNSLKRSKKIISATYEEELEHYLSLIYENYKNENTQILGFKEVWAIEMAFPIINLMGDKAKFIIVIRNPLDVVSSSFSGSSNYCILTLVRQWRKQIVFYNLLKRLYPTQVTSINYEEFCSQPNSILRNKFSELIKVPKDIISEKLKLVDDAGMEWVKNSSYKEESLSKNIDTKSVGKYLDKLSVSEIEWIKYLTYMNSYINYNFTNKIPSKPKSNYPKKKNINNISEWAKAEILKLEGENLNEELKSEHERIERIGSLKIQKDFNLDSIITQI